MTRTGFAAVERPKPKRNSPRKPTKVYELYPQGFGGFSCRPSTTTAPR